MTVAVPEQLSIPELVAAVAADFVARGITAPVLYGTWEVWTNRSDSRVVIGLSPFIIDAPGPENTPGYAYDAGSTTIDGQVDPLVAPACASVYQTAKVYVYAAPHPDPKTANRSILVQRAAAALLGATIAAIWRYANGSITWGPGEWPEEGRVKGIVYGSCAVFTVQLAIPVLNDPVGGDLFPDPATPVGSFTLG